MSDRTPDDPSYALTVLTIVSAAPASYTLDEVARLVGVHPEMIRFYRELGVAAGARETAAGEWVFDDDALYELRRLELHRRQHRMNRRALRLLAALWRQVDALEREVRFLRRR